MTDIKILLMGTVQPNFMNQLYSNLQKEEKYNFEVHILGDNNKPPKEYRFKHKVIANDLQLSFGQFLTCFFTVCRKTSVSEFLLDLRVRGIRKLGSILRERIKACALVTYTLSQERYDFVQMYYCYSNHIIPFLSENQKFITSIWGSDLFRQSGVYSYHYQLQALNRADIISIHSVEMKEVLLAKFGRHLSDKVHVALFPQETTLYEKLKNVSDSDVTAFKNKYDIPTDRIVISIGHNAKRENNQTKIVHELGKLDQEIKDQIVCIFPLNYGSKDKELFGKELVDLCSAHGIIGRAFTEFFNVHQQASEYATFRKIQDVFVHLLISDALSHYVTEAMYAGNIVITGSWLPYGTFRSAGLSFNEIESIDYLAPLLSRIVQEGLEKHLPNLESQRKAIEDKFFPEPTTVMWLNLYTEASTRNKQ